MTNYHDHCIAPSAPKAGKSLVSLIEKSNETLSTIAENTAPAEDSTE